MSSSARLCSLRLSHLSAPRAPQDYEELDVSHDPPGRLVLLDLIMGRKYSHHRMPISGVGRSRAHNTRARLFKGHLSRSLA